MSQKRLTPAALRGAVDLSALKRPPAGTAPRGPAAGPDVSGGWTAAGRAGLPGGAGTAEPSSGDGELVLAATDRTFQDVATTSVRVPVVIVLYSTRLPESGSYVGVLADIARSYEGRFQLVTVDVDTNPGLLRAFQIQSVPAVVGLVQGQPVPLFIGALPPAEVTPWIDELLKLALQYGITGRVQVGDAAAAVLDDAAEDEPELPPLHAEAYDAIERGDLDGAAAAYEKALAQNPADGDAALGLGQVRLLQRTQGVDLAAARAAAAADPLDVAAQTVVADLDLLGGHVADAFARLVDTVRATSGEDRNAARQHLLGLFDLVGATDERVVKARKALMSALF